MVIVDGHNLIGALPDLNLSDPDDEEKLVLKLKRYRARTGRKVMVVFDPGGGYRPGSKRTKGGVTVWYAPHGATADKIIAGYARAEANPRRLLVVSSDREVQRAAGQAGAAVMSSTDFGLTLARPVATVAPETDPHLSPEEVEEWLRLFNRADDSEE